MNNKQNGAWIRFRGSVRSRMVRGLLVLVPVVITALVLTFIFGITANILAPVLEWTLKSIGVIEKVEKNGLRDSFLVGAVSIIVLMLVVYFMGWLAGHVLGRRLIGTGESMLMRVPLVKSIYSASKQVVQAISLPDKAAFKAVVLVEFPRAGGKAIGFLTGHVELAGRDYCKVFIPTAPNPTSGFLQFFPEEEVQLTTMSIEDAFKMIISGGILAPESFTFRSAAAGQFAQQAAPLSSETPSL